MILGRFLSGVLGCVGAATNLVTSVCSIEMIIAFCCVICVSILFCDSNRSKRRLSSADGCAGGADGARVASGAATTGA